VAVRRGVSGRPRLHDGDRSGVPYGYGGTKGNDGTPCFDDFAGSCGGGAAPEFVRRLAAGDRSEDDPATSPRVIMREYFGPRTNTENVDEEFLLDESLRTRVGDDFYPGDSTPSGNWPGLAPGTRGVLNAMTPAFSTPTACMNAATSSANSSLAQEPVAALVRPAPRKSTDMHV